MVYADGSRYEGSWLNNQCHDKGIFEAKNGFFTSYDGEWAHGVKSGKGKMTFTDGSVYDGGFVDDLMHGHGTLTLNGCEIEGKWVKGIRDGKTTILIESGSQKIVLDPTNPIQLIDSYTTDPWEQTYFPNNLPAPPYF